MITHTITMKFRLSLLITFAAFSAQAASDGADGPLCDKSATKTATYLNSKVPREKRVKDLLSRMCWEEKVAQIGGVGGILGQNSKLDVKDYREKAQMHNGTICRFHLSILAPEADK